MDASKEDASKERAGGRPANAPTVFLSYRTADTLELVDLLEQHLDDDLGARSVFRDRKSLIGGQPWQECIDHALADSDVCVFIIGPDWLGDDEDPPRIDHADDPIRREIQIALSSDTAPIPVLVDLDHPPQLDDELAPLFRAHAIRTESADLISKGSDGYQAILVSLWEATKRRGDVLVLGNATIDVKALVDHLMSTGAVDTRQLTQLASGVWTAPKRRLRRLARRLPDVIVVVDDASDRTLAARIAAASRHPALQRISFFGAGFAAGLAIAAGGSSGSGATLTSHESASELAESLVAGARRTASGWRRWWSDATTTAKIATAGAAVAVVGTGAVVVGNPLASDIVVGATVPYGYVDVTLDDVDVVDAPDPETEPTAERLEEYEAIEADTGVSPLDLAPDEQLVSIGLTFDEQSDALDWTFDTGELIFFELDGVLYDVAGNQRIDLAAEQSVETRVAFVLPGDVDAGAGSVVVQQYARTTDRRLRPAVLELDGGTVTSDLAEREIPLSNRFSELGGCEAELEMHAVRIGDDLGLRPSGGPVWNPRFGDRLARPAEGHTFVTVVGTASRERVFPCAAGQISWMPPYLVDDRGLEHEVVSGQGREFREWTRQAEDWIWTFEISETTEQVELRVDVWEIAVTVDLDGA